MKYAFLFTMILLIAIVGFKGYVFAEYSYSADVITRLEAARILVESIELDDVLAAHVYTHPFNDVRKTDDAVVGFLYENKIVFGTSADTFSPDTPCTLNMYLAMVFRALDFTEQNGDFEYENIGINNTDISSYEFNALREYTKTVIEDSGQSEDDLNNIFLSKNQLIYITLYSNVTRIKSNKLKLMDKFTDF